MDPPNSAPPAEAKQPADGKQPIDPEKKALREAQKKEREEQKKKKQEEYEKKQALKKQKEEVKSSLHFSLYDAASWCFSFYIQEDKKKRDAAAKEAAEEEKAKIRLRKQYESNTPKGEKKGALFVSLGYTVDLLRFLLLLLQTQVWRWRNMIHLRLKLHGMIGGWRRCGFFVFFFIHLCCNHVSH